MIVASSIVAPIAASTAVDFISRSFSNWQSNRLLSALQIIRKKIGFHLNSGQSLRMDGEMSAVNGEQAKQVLEGILQNIADEYEKKKLEAHASFFANLCFDEHIIFTQAMYLNKIIKRLTYRQLVVIAIFHESSVKVQNWSFSFDNYTDDYIFNSYTDLYCEIRDLEQKVIIEDTNPIATAEGSPLNTFKLSPFGLTIYRELDLSTIPKEDIDNVVQMLINKGCKIYSL